MKIIIILMMVFICNSSLFGWETNTHRAIDQVALEGDVLNLTNFINDAQIGTKKYNSYER